MTCSNCKENTWKGIKKLGFFIATSIVLIFTWISLGLWYIICRFFAYNDNFDFSDFPIYVLSGILFTIVSVISSTIYVYLIMRAIKHKSLLFFVPIVLGIGLNILINYFVDQDRMWQMLGFYWMFASPFVISFAVGFYRSEKKERERRILNTSQSVEINVVRA